VSATRVQNASDGVDGAALTVTLTAAPTGGNLLVAWANSDALVSIGGSGWNAGPSIIDGNGAYSWWKVAGGGEPSSVTFTPSVSDWITAGVLEYAGLTGTPLDTSGSAMISGTPSTSTTTVTLTSAADHELGIALALLHASSPNANPTAPSWSGGYSTVQAQGVAGGPSKVYSLIGDNLDLGAAGSRSVAASWTGAWPDAQALVLLFTAVAGAHGAAAPASTSALSASGTRIVPGAAALASSSAAAAGGRQIAHGTAAATASSAATAAGHGTAHAAAHPASVSAMTAVPDAHSRRTLRPDLGRTLRP
jgi:hypothetical protein